MAQQRNTVTENPKGLEDAKNAWSCGEYADAMEVLDVVLEQEPHSVEALETKARILRHERLNRYIGNIIQKRYLDDKIMYRGLSADDELAGSGSDDLAYDNIRALPKPLRSLAARINILRFADDVIQGEASKINIGDVEKRSAKIGTSDSAYLYGLAAFRLGHHEQAIAALEKAVTKEPPCNEACELLSYVLTASRRVKRAAALAHLAVIHVNRIWCLTGAISADALSALKISYKGYCPLQTDAARLRYAPESEFLVLSLPRHPIRVPLGFKLFLQRLLPRSVQRSLQALVDHTSLSVLLRRPRR